MMQKSIEPDENLLHIDFNVLKKSLVFTIGSTFGGLILLIILVAYKLHKTIAQVNSLDDESLSKSEETAKTAVKLGDSAEDVATAPLVT